MSSGHCGRLGRATRIAGASPPPRRPVGTQWREKRIGDSLNIPLTRLVQRLGELPRDRPVVVHCASGYRSAIGARLLLREGFGELADLVGGIAAWESSRLETVPAGAR